MISLRYLYHPTYAPLDGLLAGVALAACAVHRPTWMVALRSRTFLLLGLSTLALTAALLRFDAVRTQFWPCVSGYPLVALAMAGFVAAASGNSSLAGLKVSSAGWLAGISYSLYLCHKGIFSLLASALGNHLARYGLLRFALFAAATLAGGGLLHDVVERPFLRWRDDRAGRSIRAPRQQQIAADNAS